MRQIRTITTFSVCIVILFVYATWSVQRIPESENIHEFSETCAVSLKDTRSKRRNLPTIYFVTPTYPRREQIAEMIQLGQTLLHVSDLHWIVADDRQNCNSVITELLDRLGIPYTYLVSPMPAAYQKSNSYKPRGVSNRRAALQWIRKNAQDGVIYFGDDDNTFDIRLFDEIRSTEKVSMFPVGLIGEFGISSPIIQNGKVVGFFDSWPAKRKFPVDMAGFAVGVQFLLSHPNASMPYKVGYEEDLFLQSLNLTMNEIEVKANSCTQILVWHTQTVKRKVPSLKISTFKSDNLKGLMTEAEKWGIAHVSSKGIKTYTTANGKETVL